MKGSVEKIYIWGASVALAFTAFAKLLSVYLGGEFLGEQDTLVPLSNGALMTVVAVVEILVAIMVHLVKSKKVSYILLLWLSGSFVAYRVADNYFGSVQSCLCLGGPLNPLGISAQVAHGLLTAIVLYLLLGSSWGLLFSGDSRDAEGDSDRGHRKPVAALAVFLCLGLLTGGATDVQGAGNAVEVIKDYLSSPPVIKNALVTYENARSHKTAYYHIRSQKDAYVVRQITSVDFSVPGYDKQDGYCVGRYEDDYWVINQSSDLQHWQGKYEAGSEPNSVLNVNLVQSQVLYGFLSLGVQGLVPGSVSWNGLKFTGTRRIPNVSGLFEDSEVSGELLEAAGKGVVDRIRYRSEDESYVEVRLTYQDGATLPYEFSTWFVQKGSSREMYSYKIALIEFSEESLDREMFQPTDLSLDIVSEFVYTNGMVLWNASRIASNPRYVPVDVDDRAGDTKPNSGGDQGNSIGRWIVLFLLGVGPVVCAAAILKVKFTEKEDFDESF